MKAKNRMKVKNQMNLKNQIVIQIGIRPLSYQEEEGVRKKRGLKLKIFYHSKVTNNEVLKLFIKYPEMEERMNIVLLM